MKNILISLIGSLILSVAYFFYEVDKMGMMVGCGISPDGKTYLGSCISYGIKESSLWVFIISFIVIYLVGKIISKRKK